MLPELSGKEKRATFRHATKCLGFSLVKPLFPPLEIFPDRTFLQAEFGSEPTGVQGAVPTSSRLAGALDGDRENRGEIEPEDLREKFSQIQAAESTWTSQVVQVMAGMGRDQTFQSSHDPAYVYEASVLILE